MFMLVHLEIKTMSSPLVSDIDRLVILLEEIAYAESQMETNIAIKPIVVYMQKRVTNIKERLDASTK